MMVSVVHDVEESGTKKVKASRETLNISLIRHNVITLIKAHGNPHSPSHFNMISVIPYLTSLQGS